MNSDTYLLNVWIIISAKGTRLHMLRYQFVAKGGQLVQILENCQAQALLQLLIWKNEFILK